jgi:hypothetical protein
LCVVNRHLPASSGKIPADVVLALVLSTMMRAGFLLLILGVGVAAVGPYLLELHHGEADSNSVSNPTGRGEPILPIITAPDRTAVIITTGGSNISSSAGGSYAVANIEAVQNFSIYDGQIYKCVNPVLGASRNPIGGSNSANCQIGDALVSAGIYDRVIMVPTAVHGSFCELWAYTILKQRAIVTMRWLRSVNLAPTWILPHLGEVDAQRQTPRAVLAQCFRDWAQLYVDHGAGAARFFVPIESMVTWAINPTVQTAQADAIASGCPTCRRGADVDSLGGPNRLEDGVHWSELGAANLAALDVAVIARCKRERC